MLFRTYELRPGFSSMYERTRSGFYGTGVISVGSYGNSYSIFVGVKNRKPTTPEMERIERSIRGAWESLFDPQGWSETYARDLYAPPYGLAVVPDFSSPAGETELPEFSKDGFYIVFALLETEGSSAVSEEEEKSTHERLYQAITAQYARTKNKPRIALVTLYNCSVQVIEGPGPNDRGEEPPPRRRY